MKLLYLEHTTQSLRFNLGVFFSAAERVCDAPMMFPSESIHCKISAMERCDGKRSLLPYTRPGLLTMHCQGVGQGQDLDQRTKKDQKKVKGTTKPSLAILDISLLPVWMARSCSDKMSVSVIQMSSVWSHRPYQSSWSEKASRQTRARRDLKKLEDASEENMYNVC